MVATKKWLKMSGITDGAVFRRISAHDTMCSEQLSALVALIIKRYVERIGLDAKQYSGHSLRVGLVTSAAMAGAANWRIREQTGHKSDEMLARYIRASRSFSTNVGKLIQWPSFFNLNVGLANDFRI